MRIVRLLATTSVFLLALAATAQQPAAATPPPTSSPANDAIKPPDHPITADQVRQLMLITHATERMQAGMTKMIAQQQAAMPIFPPAFWTDFQAEFAKIDWVAIATPIYQKYLSQEDAAKSIAFYSSDAGQRSLKSSTAVVEEMSAKGFDVGKEIGTRLGQKYQKEIEENARKLQQSRSSQPN